MTMCCIFILTLCIMCNTVVGWNKYNKIQIFKKIGNMIECSLLIVSLLGTNMGFNRHLKRFKIKTQICNSKHFKTQTHSEKEQYSFGINIYQIDNNKLVHCNVIYSTTSGQVLHNIGRIKALQITFKKILLPLKIYLSNYCQSMKVCTEQVFCNIETKKKKCAQFNFVIAIKLNLLDSVNHFFE